MPYLRRFAARGVRAELGSTIPSNTPAAWTTIMTGRSPGHHGVLDFFRQKSLQSRFLRYVTTQQLRCGTIWTLLKRYDVSSISLNFPVMAPPLPIKGYSIPGYVTWRHMCRACYPSDLMDTLKSIPGFDLKIIGHDVGLEEKVVMEKACTDAEAWINYHTYKDDQWLLIMSHLAKTGSCRFGALVLDSLDPLQHVFYRLLDPGCFPMHWSTEDRRIRAILERHFKSLDDAIARLATAFGTGANVFIVSGHGFGPSEECFHLNSFLAELGYLRWSDQTVDDQDCPGDVAMGAVRNRSLNLNWENTRAFASTPAINGITINVRGRNDDTGIAPEDYHRFLNTLRDQLTALRHPRTGKPVVLQTWTREEAFEGCEWAPDLTLRLWDNGQVSTAQSETIIGARRDVAGVHHPAGVFMAAGPDIRTGLELDPLNILDVAPAVLYSLGLPIPEDFEGGVPEEMLRREALAARSVAYSSSALPIENQSVSVLEMDDEDMVLIVKRLRGLGYLP